MDEQQMSEEKCHTCGNVRSSYEMKKGWTNCLYCCEECERKHVSAVHGSMPGGKLPRLNWVPHHVGVEISRRWEENT